MPAKLITTIRNIEIKVENETNRHLIKDDNPTYHELMCIIFSIGSLGAGLKDVPL